ncbi:MAG TPA: cystathionine gamma-synthase [Actinomycetota bacterium]|nr:cystathionine gamma-synthase [Actinomycetota bacterium]
MNEDWGFETRAIHAGQEPDPTTGAVIVPIYQTSTYAQEEVGKHKGYEYSRTGNPTRTAVERCLASLEGARFGLAFSSGLAASDALLRQLSPGDHIVIPNDAYGGTYRLVSKVYEPHGFRHTPVDMTSLDALAGAWTDRTRVVWVETPTNPLLTVVDIAAIAAFARERGAICVVDNTFATSWLQRPLELGADVVLHSTTKYAGGHSDLVGGFIATDDEELARKLAFTQNAVGAVPGPMDCYLLLRGVKTLAVRVERATQNAKAIVEMLAGHPKVARVLYPGLPDHPGHEVAAKQMKDFGAMVSFIHAEGEQAAVDLCSRTRLFTLAESLGAVESLIEHPGRMTHASTVGSMLEVDPALVRLSVGIESTEDLVEDLRTALG